MLHGNIGMYVVPVLAIALVAIALFAHAGLKWALLTLLAVVVQIGLAFAAFGAPWVGMLHGINAFAILALAEVAAYSDGARRGQGPCSAPCGASGNLAWPQHFPFTIRGQRVEEILVVAGHNHGPAK